MHTRPPPQPCAGPDYGDALPESPTCHVQPGRWWAFDAGLPFFPANELQVGWALGLFCFVWVCVCVGGGDAG